MNTCLSGLWEILIEQYYGIVQDEVECVEESDCKAEMDRIIDGFYAKAKLHKPLHVEIFQQELLKEKNRIQDAANKADEEVNKCNLCVVCNECAKKFYNVLQGKKVERPLPLELKNYFSDNGQLYYYLAAYKTVKSYRRINNTLICLKGFSSTTPAIYSATFEDTCTGGGLYLNVDGFGIAIDPGIGFVDSMHKQGIFIEDIHAVVVTHNHLDHNADIGTISALLHDINRYYKGQVTFYEKFFQGVNKKTHTIRWWFDESTQEVNKGIISKSTLLSQCADWTALSDKVSIAAIETKHMRENDKSYGIKCRICLNQKKVMIGYTSDTRFFPELSEFMADTDILIFHISDIYEKDVRGLKQKKSHLGYDGSVNLLQGEKQRYRLAIASEFCCSNGDYRMRVVKKLEEQLRKDKTVSLIPGEVGLKVDLQSEGIYCSRCKRIVPFNSISVVSPEREFGVIRYICKKCQYRLE